MPKELCYRDMVLPRQLNHHGSMFGGEVCSLIDKAAANLLRMKSSQKFVTLIIKSLKFMEPIHSGDLVTVFGEIVNVGKTSVTIEVEAIAERSGQKVKVTKSTLVFVAIDESGDKTQVVLK
ncbi:acyl-CoA thioesterase [Alteromonas macleodii]|uniref:acyl-CoA thioesterase n=1 Tax=Alteromonas macleodii TaxID=28108 RepID=UPI00313FFEFC|tara:strand:- start:212567 stop:212929 length:363 start_codon:yes stop_codon:yes gene_type:complete